MRRTRPEAAGPPRSRSAGKADELRPAQPGQSDGHRLFPKAALQRCPEKASSAPTLRGIARTRVAEDGGASPAIAVGTECPAGRGDASAEGEAAERIAPLCLHGPLPPDAARCRSGAPCSCTMRRCASAAVTVRHRHGPGRTRRAPGRARRSASRIPPSGFSRSLPCSGLAIGSARMAGRARWQHLLGLLQRAARVHDLRG